MSARSHVPVLLLLAALAACNDDQESSAARSPSLEPTAPRFTAASGGYQSKPLARATFTDPKDPMLTAKRHTGEWYVELKAKPALDVAVQTIDFPGGSASGWHSHPGPVFIQVVKGTLRFYEGDDPHCGYVEKTAPDGFLDLGEHAHIARNETADSAKTVVVYLAPAGAALRRDEPRPGNCAF
jgi:hypothetical protein